MNVDLRTRYLGIDLRSPIVPSASPIGQRMETLQAAQDAGAGAMVLPSLFEEQIEHDELQLHGALAAFRDATAEALTYLPDIGDYNTGVDAYLRHVEDAKKALEIPLIASLNGIGLGNWVAYAKRMQEAGADAIELNVYFRIPDIQRGVLVYQTGNLFHLTQDLIGIPFKLLEIGTANVQHNRLSTKPRAADALNGLNRDAQIREL